MRRLDRRSITISQYNSLKWHLAMFPSLVRESSESPTSFPPPLNHQPIATVTPLLFKGGDDHLPSDEKLARLPYLLYIIIKNADISRLQKTDQIDAKINYAHYSTHFRHMFDASESRPMCDTLSLVIVNNWLNWYICMYQLLYCVLRKVVHEEYQRLIIQVISQLKEIGHVYACWRYSGR